MRTYTAEEKQEYVAQWRQSGQGQSEFAKDQNIPYTTFRHWVDGRKKKRPSTASIVNQPAFVAIQVENKAIQSTTPQPIMELCYSSGHRINFYQTVNTEYIRNLLQLC